eukprot:1643293-Amphidinium_carterae.1
MCIRDREKGAHVDAGVHAKLNASTHPSASRPENVTLNGVDTTIPRTRMLRGCMEELVGYPLKRSAPQAHILHLMNTLAMKGESARHDTHWCGRVRTLWRAQVP